MNQKEYWDSVCEEKVFTTPFHPAEFAKYVKKDDFIVDIGCGYGRTLRELKDMGYNNLRGYDFSENMIKRGKRENPDLDLRIKETEAIGLPDESADVVILFAVLTSIVSDKEQKDLISEIHSVLKPNGIFYLTDFLLNDDDRNLERYEKYQDELGVYGAFKLSEGATLRHHSEDHIFDLTESFNQKEYQSEVYDTMNGHISNGFFYIGMK